MILIKKRAQNDLRKYFEGLLKWSVKTNTKNKTCENRLSREHTIKLYNNIVDECYSIDQKTYNAPSRYPDHLRFGKYVHTYKTNKRTNIYIIYDINNQGIILIKKITTNYKTISEIK